MSAAAIVEPALSLEVPRTLPVRTLSCHSIRLFEQCGEKWRRRYVLKEKEQAGVGMLAGRAYGAVVQEGYWARIKGEPALSLKDADDLLVSEFEEEVSAAEADGRLAEGSEDPDQALETARAPLRGYIESVLPRAPEPRAIERELRLRFPGAEWSFVAYLDVDCAEGVIDHKLGESSKWSPGQGQRTADGDLQAGWYLMGRALAAEPADWFEFHCARPGSEAIRIFRTRRSPQQLDYLQRRVALAARRIAYAQRTGDWGYGTEGWWCSPRWCGSWRSCPAGGGLVETTDKHQEVEWQTTSTG